MHGPKVFSIVIMAPSLSETELNQYIVIGPSGRWWRFEYDGKPRVGLVLGARGDCLYAITPDGPRSFKPGKMMGIVDETAVV